MRRPNDPPAFPGHGAFVILATVNCGEMAESVEGAPLLREYGVKSSIEGSNPSLSATPFLDSEGGAGRSFRFADVRP